MIAASGAIGEERGEWDVIVPVGGEFKTYFCGQISDRRRVLLLVSAAVSLLVSCKCCALLPGKMHGLRVDTDTKSLKSEGAP